MILCHSPLSSRSISSRFHRQSCVTTVVARRFGKLFAGALVFGFGVGSALAAPNDYYPTNNPPTATYYPTGGIPISSSPELALIEAKLNQSGKTLVLPPVTPLVTASAADYKAAVQAVAQDVVAAVSIPSAGGTVTIASLTDVVSTYLRSGGSISDALNGLGTGIVVAAGPNLVANLNTAAFEATKSNLGVVSVGKLSGLFQAAANSNSTVNQVGAMLQNALNGSAAASPTTTLSAAAISGQNNLGSVNIIKDAMDSIIASTAPNAATVSQKQALFLTLGTGAGASTAMSGSNGNSTANLDAAAAQLTSNTTYVDPTTSTMISNIAAGVVFNDVNYGAIAQGVLRNTAYRNATGYSVINTAVGASTYASKFVTAFSGFGAAYSGTTIATMVAAAGSDPAAIAAASVVRFPTQSAQVEGDVLVDFNNVGDTATIRKIIRSIVGAYQGNANFVRYGINRNTGGSLAAYANAEDVVYGAIQGSAIKDAGAFVKSGLLYSGLTTGSAANIVSNAIAAAASVSPLTNVQNAYADIAYNVGTVYRTGGNVAWSTASVTALVNAITTVTVNNGGSAADAPTFIGVVGQLAGNLKNNYSAILAAGLAASASDDDNATQAGANLINAMPVTNYGMYQATIAAFAAAIPGGQNIDNHNLALLYAASLWNPTDSSATLAAAIAATNVTSAADLTKAAVSANRALQANLSVASTVASHAKLNLGDIQQYVGQQILDNPSYIADVTTAATVVVPQFSHVIGATLGFNAPTTASSYVVSIFLHSQIIIPGTLQSERVGGNTDPNGAGGRPAAVAAISAGLTTGIVLNTQLSTTDKKNALSNMIRQVVLTMSNTAYNDQGLAIFRQSDGGIGTLTLTKATGTAGAITGFVAQMVSPGDTTTGGAGSPLYDALTAAANQAGSTYIYAVAQAAGQAFGWVSGKVLVAAGTAPSEIAAAITAGVSGAVLANVQNAVNFGFNEAAGGEIVGNPARRPGAGAGGLTSTAVYYAHSSAQGTPVSNIFTL